MMHSIAILLGVIAVALIASTSVSAQKSGICVPLTANSTVINPSLIPSSVLPDMSNRGKGSYTINVNLCSAGPAAPGCTEKSYVSASNKSAGCMAEFTRAIMRPTLLTVPGVFGFKVAYADTASNFSAIRNVVEIIVLCHGGKRGGGALISRSRKFWGRANKWGGTTYMMMLGTTSCHPPPVNPSHHHHHGSDDPSHHHHGHRGDHTPGASHHNNHLREVPEGAADNTQGI